MRISHSKSIKPALIALAIAAATMQADAAPGEQIGSAVQVVNLVTAALDTDKRALRTGDGVRQQEEIVVAKNARSEFILNDDTKLALGPGAKLVLDKFVYDPDKTANAIIINMVRGTFRFITGLARKPSYVIKTPSAAITVRGTIFDVYVQGSGESWVLLHEGGVQVCNVRGKCVVHDQPGKMLVISADGEISNAVCWSNLVGVEPDYLDTAFPFVAAAPGIDPNPVFTRSAILKCPKDANAAPPQPERKASVESDEPDPAPVARREKAAPRQASSQPARAERVKAIEPNDEPRKRSRAKSEADDTPRRSTRVATPSPRPEHQYERQYDEPRRHPRPQYVKNGDDDDHGDRPPHQKKYEKYADHHDDDHKDHDRPRRERGGSGVGRLLLGAALIGGAIEIGSGGGHGGY